MLKGIVIRQDSAAVLQQGVSYYLFPNGPGNFYASKFPNPNSHTGCFQASYFKITEHPNRSEEPKIITLDLDPNKIYKANLIWRKPGYSSTGLKEYFIKPNQTHCYFYNDIHLKSLGGCFPLHWFVDFKEITNDDSFLEIIEQKIPDLDINFVEDKSFFTDSEQRESYEQLSLFY